MDNQTPHPNTESVEIIVKDVKDLAGMPKPRARGVLCRDDSIIVEPGAAGSLFVPQPMGTRQRRKSMCDLALEGALAHELHQ